MAISYLTSHYIQFLLHCTMVSGNPVSATVTAHLYVLPACRRIGGHERPFPALVRARLMMNNDGGAARLDPRPEYRRVHLSWKPGEAVAEARTTRGHQMSSRYIAELSKCSLIIYIFLQMLIYIKMLYYIIKITYFHIMIFHNTQIKFDKFVKCAYFTYLMH